jgi:hypothetical protein
MLAHFGSVWAKISLKGKLVHTAHSGLEGNLILQMYKIVKAIEEWAPDYQARSPFTSYEDIKNRTGHPNPSEAICKRIVQELRDREEKYRIFVREPVREFH